jgi:hypothetical protein
MFGSFIFNLKIIFFEGIFSIRRIGLFKEEVVLNCPKANTIVDVSNNLQI